MVSEGRDGRTLILLLHVVIKLRLKSDEGSDLLVLNTRRTDTMRRSSKEATRTQISSEIKREWIHGRTGQDLLQQAGSETMGFHDS
jgi:hypothetical protein